MKYGIYAIRDAAAGVFTAPTIDISDHSAMRNFQQACANADSVMNFAPNDFALYKIGSFDAELGFIEPDSPTVIMNGINCVKKGKE